MGQKTVVRAEEGQQELVITREFDLPLELLFKAYVEPELVAQWMGTNVLKLDSRKHGNYQFETADAQGNVVFRGSGVIHEFIPNQTIVRTFEMESLPNSAFRFAPQLEFLDFEKRSDTTSKLTMQIVYKSVALRDQQLQLPFAQGINMAHNRLQHVLSQVNGTR